MWVWALACGGPDEPEPSDPPVDPTNAHSAETTPESSPPPEHSSSPTEPEPLETFRTPGPYVVELSDTSSTATSCNSMAVSVFTPTGTTPAHVVVVAHGFSGRRQDMVGWGEHLASWGFVALVPTMCHSSPLDVDHRQNGLDLVDLAADQAPGLTPFYVGYSAGGLAAMVAATEDASTGGHLGLDMVDAFGIGEGAAPSLTAPAAALVSDPSACNTRNNGIPLYEEAGAAILAVPGADHCDFTNPASASCGFLCSTGPDEPRIPQAIATLTTSWLLWRSGLDPRGSTWWTAGEPGFDELVATGWITPP